MFLYPVMSFDLIRDILEIVETIEKEYSIEIDIKRREYFKNLEIFSWYIANQIEITSMKG
jgi:hypothetical protein